jgi:UDP-2-acetamido-3-amino-2,3-dideoxy-glucuronate N-acetyltransferase
VLEACQRSLELKGVLVSLANDENQYFVHETAVVESPHRVGTGSKIWHFSHIMLDALIGEDCVLGQNVFVGRGVRIGNRVKIQNNVSVYEGVTIEDDVFCGPSCVFTNVMNPRSEIDRRDQFLPTLVKRGATIGANATIICGITVGQYAFVGAGSVVTKDVPNFGLVYGNPARLQGWMCRCGTRLNFDGFTMCTCQTCGLTYLKNGAENPQIEPTKGGRNNADTVSGPAGSIRHD